MRGLKILPGIIYPFSRASSQLYRCATAAFVALEPLTMLNGFLKDANFGPLSNL